MDEDNQLKWQPVATGTSTVMLGTHWISWSMAVKTFSRLTTSSIYALPHTYSPTLAELECTTMRTLILRDHNGLQMLQNGQPVVKSIGASTSIICNLLNATVSAFNCSRTMSDWQIWRTAHDMVEFFPQDPIAMLKIFYKLVRSGYFGRVYDVIDEPTLIGWYRSFRADTLNSIDRLRIEPPSPSPENALPEGRMSAAEIDAICSRICKRISINRDITDTK